MEFDKAGVVGDGEVEALDEVVVVFPVYLYRGVSLVPWREIWGGVRITR